MPRYKDLTNQTFGRLTALSYSGINIHRVALWLCKCSCGNEKIIRSSSLLNGATRSCGCLNDETRRIKHKTEEQKIQRKKRNWKDWYLKNKEKQIEKIIRFSKEHKKEWNEYRRERQAERMKDPLFRTIKNIRGRLYTALKRNPKKGMTIEELGCSIEAFKKHLESKFYDRKDGTKMSWENYGRGGWEIDHIIPLITLSQGKSVKELTHYTNVQPLWCEDNIKKRNKDLQALGLVG